MSGGGGNTVGSLVTVVKRYREAWNRHDPAAVRDAFAPDGYYLSPLTGGRLTGVAIERHARELLVAFPDLVFEECGGGAAGDDLAVLEWLLRGTQTGPLNGNTPTGSTIALPGVELLTITAAGIVAARVYFDRRAFAEQLGLRVLVQPASLGRLTFGYCVRMASIGGDAPGLLTLSVIRGRSENDMPRLVEVNRSLMARLDTTPGFLHHLGAVVGTAMWTVTGWSGVPPAARHLDVAAWLASGGVESAETSIWIPAPGQAPSGVGASARRRVCL